MRFKSIAIGSPIFFEPTVVYTARHSPSYTLAELDTDGVHLPEPVLDRGYHRSHTLPARLPATYSRLERASL